MRAKHETYLVRSRDLVDWELSPHNPVLKFSDDDRKPASSRLTSDERDRIAKAVNLNNSDFDLCEFQGQTIILYSWGNQMGVEHLAHARYDGDLASFFRGWYGE